jgi:hypothetical protein
MDSSTPICTVVLTPHLFHIFLLLQGLILEHMDDDGAESAPFFKKYVHITFSYYIGVIHPHIMLRDLLTQKCSQNIKLKIGYGSSLYQLFSKCD